MMCYLVAIYLACDLYMFLEYYAIYIYLYPTHGVSRFNLCTDHDIWI